MASQTDSSSPDLPFVSATDFSSQLDPLPRQPLTQSQRKPDPRVAPFSEHFSTQSDIHAKINFMNGPSAPGIPELPAEKPEKEEKKEEVSKVRQRKRLSKQHPPMKQGYSPTKALKENKKKRAPCSCM